LPSKKIGERRGRALVKENAHLLGERWLLQAAGGKVQDRDDGRASGHRLNQFVDG
jgi:hypothetical protein